MKLGIVGLPNVGKSTLFNSITKAGAECANYPFCTIEPNVGVVPVPDERLDVLAKMYNPKKITHAVIEFVDIAGLVKGASKGEGLGNKFLSHIRETDAIVEVVRCFENSNIVHVDGSIDPIRDIETINLELIFADIETVNKRLDKARKNLKADKKYQEEIDLLEKIKENLEKGISARALDFNEDEKVLVKDMFLLTTKPILYIANVSEGREYNVSQLAPLTLELDTDNYTFTLNDERISNGHTIGTEGEWVLKATPIGESEAAETINFTTSVTDANKLLPKNITVSPAAERP